MEKELNRKLFIVGPFWKREEKKPASRAAAGYGVLTAGTSNPVENQLPNNPVREMSTKSRIQQRGGGMYLSFR